MVIEVPGSGCPLLRNYASVQRPSVLETWRSANAGAACRLLPKLSRARWAVSLR